MSEMVGKRLGDFELIREIGRGGMGIVYEARQVSLGPESRPRAVKVLPAHMADNERAAERFTREAENMARLRHPNIVEVIHVGEQDGVRYFAMQYVPGRSLHDEIAKRGALPQDRAVQIATEVADALAHAHAHGVIHRDITPSNILLDEKCGSAVVTDFGIAKLGNRGTLTDTGAAWDDLDGRPVCDAATPDKPGPIPGGRHP